MSYNYKNNFLTVHDIAELLRLSVLTVYKYIKSGDLEAIEFGGHYRISKASLDLFITHHKVHLNNIKEEYEK